MGIVSTIVGLIVITAALRDMVHELFHPERAGSISHATMRVVWRLIRAMARVRRRALYHAGPAMLVAVAIVWTLMLVFGWALVYWPWLPQGFRADAALPAEATRGFGTALYVSLASVSTLGASDLTPKTGALRAATTLEAVVGIVLITSWITWVLSIYPVIAQRRTFAREVGLLRKTQPRAEELVKETPGTALTGVLRSLTEQLLSLGTHLGQLPVTYYFHNVDASTTLAEQLPYVLELACTAEAHGAEPAVRHHGRLLRTAAETVLGQLGEQFLDLEKGASPRDVLRALRRDHMLEVSARPPSGGGLRHRTRRAAP